MAQREEVILIDDIDGTEGADTISFSVNGTSYELELAAKNQAKFDKALAPFIDNARRIPKTRKTRTRA